MIGTPGEVQMTAASRPGAVHIGGGPENDEDNTVSATLDETPVAPRNLMRDELLSAQLVCDTIEDFDQIQIQFQLQRQGQQLQQVLAGLQTNNTVHVVVLSQHYPMTLLCLEVKPRIPLLIQDTQEGDGLLSFE
jgi:hypothetical protein